MHYDKWVEPGENISLAASTIKWYNLAKKDEPEPGEDICSQTKATVQSWNI